jgi:uncharacterized protein
MKSNPRPWRAASPTRAHLLRLRVTAPAEGAGESWPRLPVRAHRPDGTFRLWAHTWADAALATSSTTSRPPHSSRTCVYHYAPTNARTCSSIAARHGVGGTRVDQPSATTSRRPVSVVKKAPQVGSARTRQKPGRSTGAKIRDPEGSRTQPTRSPNTSSRGGTPPGAPAGQRMPAPSPTTTARSPTLRPRLAACPATDHGIRIRARSPSDAGDLEPSRSGSRCSRSAGPARRARSADRTAAAFAAAAIDYHRREQKSFWGASRGSPADRVWRNTRDVLEVSTFASSGLNRQAPSTPTA